MSNILIAIMKAVTWLNNMMFVLQKEENPVEVKQTLNLSRIYSSLLAMTDTHTETNYSIPC